MIRRLLKLSTVFLIPFIYSCNSALYNIQRAESNRDYDILITYTTHKEKSIRISAAKKIADGYSEKIVPYLIEMSRNLDPDIAKIALEKHADFKTNQQIKNNLIELTSSKNKNSKVNVALLNSLSEVLTENDNNNQVLITDLDAYLNSYNDLEKILAAKCYAKLGKTKGANIVEKFLLGDYFIHKREALKVIGYYKQKKHLPMLESLRREGDPTIKQLANDAIHTILGDSYYTETISLRDQNKSNDRLNTSSKMQKRSIIENDISSRIPIAVLDLDPRNVDQEIASIISDKLRARLFLNPRYVLMERQKLQEILTEHGLQMSGAVSDKTVIEIGHIIGVQKIIVGSINKISSFYSVNVRLINIKTGEIKKNIFKEIMGSIEDIYMDIVDEIVFSL